jgi:hypothetical protein
MLTVTALLNKAERFAARIPFDAAAYSDEREVCWRLIGEGRLAASDTQGALRAFAQLPHGEPKTKLFLALVRWAAEHPHARDSDRMLQLIATELPGLQLWMWRRDYLDLAPLVVNALGEDAAMRMLECLNDPFTQVIMLVAMSGTGAPDARKNLLVRARTLALGMREGDRNSALSWVAKGFAQAGFSVESESTRQAMSDELYVASDDEDEPLEELLQRRIDGEERAEPDNLARLKRWLGYAMNDLKVRWLVEQAMNGALDDVEAEGLLASGAFERLERPRQPSIHSDPSSLSPAAFAAFFFDRPVVHAHSDDWEVVMQNDRLTTADTVLVVPATDLLRDFAHLTARYSYEQVDQGLWLLLQYPCYLLEDVFFSTAISDTAAIEALRAMTRFFRDYVAIVADRFGGTIFFMWWDSYTWPTGARRQACLTALCAILEIPHVACRDAALHGLNHLYPDPEAVAIIQRYLSRHREKLSSEEIAWITACRDGRYI